MDDLIINALVLIAAVSTAVFRIFVQFPRHWSGRLRDREEDSWEYLPYSEEFTSSLKRLKPVTNLVVFFLILVSFANVLTGAGGSREPDELSRTLIVVGVMLLLPFLPLAYLIVYHNRPRFLVAPHYRHEKGVVQIRRDRGRSGRSKLRLFVITIWLAGAVLVAGLTVEFAR